MEVQVVPWDQGDRLSTSSISGSASRSPSGLGPTHMLISMHCYCTERSSLGLFGCRLRRVLPTPLPPVDHKTYQQWPEQMPCTIERSFTVPFSTVWGKLVAQTRSWEPVSLPISLASAAPRTELRFVGWCICGVPFNSFTDGNSHAIPVTHLKCTIKGFKIYTYSQSSYATIATVKF